LRGRKAERIQPVGAHERVFREVRGARSGKPFEFFEGETLCLHPDRWPVPRRQAEPDSNDVSRVLARLSLHAIVGRAPKRRARATRVCTVVLLRHMCSFVRDEAEIVAAGTRPEKNVVAIGKRLGRQLRGERTGFLVDVHAHAAEIHADFRLDPRPVIGAQGNAAAWMTDRRDRGR